MLKIKTCVTSTERETERERNLSSFRPIFLWQEMQKIWKDKSAEHLWSNYNPLDLRLKPSFYVCSNCDVFFLKKSFSGPYT